MKAFYIIFIISIVYIVSTSHMRVEFFQPEHFSRHLYFYKAISFFIIILAAQFLFKILKSIRTERYYQDFCFAFLFCSIPHFIVFFLSNQADFNWYNWDSTSILEGAIRFDYKIWHHFLTVVYTIIGYNIFPFRSGIIIFQIFIYSIAISFIYSELSKKVKYSFKWLLLLPCISFPILRMNIQPIRSCIYYIFLIIFFAIFYFKTSEKKFLKI